MFRLLLLSLVSAMVLAEDETQLLRDLLRALQSTEGGELEQARSELRRYSAPGLSYGSALALHRCKSRVLNPDDDIIWCTAKFDRYSLSTDLDAMGTNYDKLLDRLKLDGDYVGLFIFSKYEIGGPNTVKTAFLSWIGQHTPETFKSNMRAARDKVDDAMGTPDSYSKEVSTLAEVQYDVIVKEISESS
ncbi:uncharacterized protein LOC110987159 [Acanthaster planci]|uniref:Uncharacterized protein LOC110987159 n=1 Tax=Acanthaster planci TaxID=133434 RepID=A0A8B7ZKB6_ACAPL|nr:uncharacterized protein LOC110987159 [Acanthaster planci]